MLGDAMKLMNVAEWDPLGLAVPTPAASGTATEDLQQLKQAVCRLLDRAGSMTPRATDSSSSLATALGEVCAERMDANVGMPNN